MLWGFGGGVMYKFLRKYVSAFPPTKKKEVDKGVDGIVRGVEPAGEQVRALEGASGELEAFKKLILLLN